MTNLTQLSLMWEDRAPRFLLLPMLSHWHPETATACADDERRHIEKYVSM
uniref:Uncharacterized protein n=1 Tax=Arundo donax TaxID=35708 RepID=A0A0A9HMK4_ARUDO